MTAYSPDPGDLGTAGARGGDPLEIVARAARYSRWDGSQRLADLDADEILDALSDDVMAEGDLAEALRRLMERGWRSGDQTRPDLPGLQDLMDRLSRRREELREQFQLGDVLGDIRRELEEIVAEERAGVEQRLERSGRPTPETVSDDTEQGAGPTGTDDALNQLKPVRGRMAAFDCLAAAAVSLSRGGNPNKEIIILTDGQNMGWEMDNRARWEALVAGMDTMPVKPQVILRRLPLPKSFRNAAIAGIRYSREVIGTDRPVSIEVLVENTGNEAITPGAVELEIGDKKLADTGTGQLQPGARQTVRFLHQFKDAGSTTVKARVETRDELTLDDEMVSVCHVVQRLGVLVIDGNPTEPFLDRAGTFTALALAPSVWLEKKNPAQRGDTDKQGPSLDVEVLPLSRAGSVASFSKYDAVIMADVPKLPEGTARRLAGWVQGGGGLLILPGVQAQTDFYNTWRDADGGRLTPSRMVMDTIPGEPVGVALNTLTHPALRLVADAKQSDLGGTLLHRYWRLEPDPAGGASTGGRLANGDPFLTGSKTGFGTVLMTCANFDTAAGNIASRQAFVALVHQLVYYLANPEGQPLNRPPAAELNIPLTSSSAEGGLKGEYFKRATMTDPVLVRIDPRPEFQWGGGRPGPGVPEDFTARWTGALLPRYSEEYSFEGWGDDQLGVWVDGQRLFERGGEAKIKLHAGRYYPIRIELRDDSGGAAMQLTWRSQSQPREVIPSDCLTPFPPNAPSTESSVGRMAVTGPDGRPRSAELVFTRGGLAARLSNDIVPGLYEMSVPKDKQKEYAALLAKNGNIPFSVTDDASESRLTEMGPPEFDFMKKRVALLMPASSQDVLNILAGRESGEELWKYLAVGALFLLLCEIALTRWIAMSRRSGEEVTVDFEHKFEPSQQFKEQLAKVKEMALN